MAWAFEGFAMAHTNSAISQHISLLWYTFLRSCASSSHLLLHEADET